MMAKKTRRRGVFNAESDKRAQKMSTRQHNTGIKVWEKKKARKCQLLLADRVWIHQGLTTSSSPAGRESNLELVRWVAGLIGRNLFVCFGSRAIFFSILFSIQYFPTCVDGPNNQPVDTGGHTSEMDLVMSKKLAQLPAASRRIPQFLTNNKYTPSRWAIRSL